MNSGLPSEHYRWRVGVRHVPSHCHLDPLVIEFRFTFGVNPDFPERTFLRREDQGYTHAMAQEFVGYLNWRQRDAKTFYFPPKDMR